MANEPQRPGLPGSNMSSDQLRFQQNAAGCGYRFLQIAIALVVLIFIVVFVVVLLAIT